MATLEQAKQQIEENGSPLPEGHPIPDGKFHRYGEKKAYWYRLHEILMRQTGQVAITGTFGVWVRDDENRQDIAMDWTGVTPEDRAAAEVKRRELEAANAAKLAQSQANAAIRANQQWAAASKEGTSPYVERKQVTAPGMRYQTDGTMLVPAVVFDGASPARLVGLQKISPDGTKRFNAGMAMIGACCPIGKIEQSDRLLFIAEGYATGRSVRMGTNDSVSGYCAFNAGNIMVVAQMARARHPDVHILIIADDDHLLRQRMAAFLLKDFNIEAIIEIDGKDRAVPALDGNKVQVMATWRKDARGVPFIEVDARAGRRMKVQQFVNTGIARAAEAARAVGNASIFVPRFSERGENKWTDANDLHVQESLGELKMQLSAAIFAALTPESVKAKIEEAEQAEVAAQAPSNVVQLPPPKKAKKGRAAKSATAGGEDGAGAPPDQNEDNTSTSWERALVRNDEGKVVPTLVNVYHILVNCPAWNGVLAYEEFSGQVVKRILPPFSGSELGEWSDMDDLRATLWMQQAYGFAPRKDIVMDAVLLVADLNKFHVVRQYLDPLVWDRQPRLDLWTIRCLGAGDTEYNRRVARKWLIGAVARIYRPGCKVDNVLILEGTQGLYKSTALKVLGGDWFTDAPFRLGDKDGYVVMRGKWLIELAELDSFNKAESNGAKQFFGQYVDRYRNFYGKRATDVPRQQAFAGTTNSNSYLKDETGNRRYWPVKATLIDLEELRATRDQLWAEAVAMFRDDVPWWETADDHDLFVVEQEERYVGDAYTPLIASGLIGKLEVSMADILGDILKLDTAKWTKPEQQRVGRCMAELGWPRKRSSKVVMGKRDWIYVKPTIDGEAPAAQTSADDGPF